MLHLSCAQFVAEMDLSVCNIPMRIYVHTCPENQSRNVNCLHDMQFRIWSDKWEQA